jgi:hypothetical protein
VIRTKVRSARLNLSTRGRNNDLGHHTGRLGVCGRIRLDLGAHKDLVLRPAAHRNSAILIAIHGQPATSRDGRFFNFAMAGVFAVRVVAAGHLRLGIVNHLRVSKRTGREKQQDKGLRFHARYTTKLASGYSNSLRAEYEKRLAARKQAVAAHERAFRIIGNYRLAVAVAGAFLTWWNFWLLPIPVVLFIALLVYHERVSHSRDCEKRAIAYYERGLARLDNRWSGSGETGDRFRDPAHPYAEDLDLFGNGSVFQLLSTARTSGGEDMLASWLLRPSPADALRARHEAIVELKPRIDLREDLALLGEEIRADVHPEAVTRWGESSAITTPRPARIMAWMFTIVTVSLFAAWAFQLCSWRVLALAVLAQSVFGLWLRNPVLRILHAVESPSHDLDLLAKILARFEKEPFSSPRLAALQKELETEGLPPSRQIARLHRLVDANEWTHNRGFTLIARLLLWSTHLALAIEDWRRREGPQIGRWIEALSEMEALSSLASYAAEHPACPFPDFAAAGPLFHAEGLAHPLLPESSAVRNDVRLDNEMRLLIVSGSNMSGKSTLLRAVGLNTVLAWAGAPVCVRALTISPLAVGASIRIQDSLQDGKSRFYAEITRLRQIVDLASAPQPLLFLLDELLSGTNSHDRRIGAEAIVTSLVRRGAVGLVTTHDLALAGIVEELGSLALNVHFEDYLNENQIAFDYLMKPGVVRKSNALELMRSIGLDV